MRARYGEQSRNRVIFRWHRASASHPDNPPYEIQLHDDGILTCNCNGWCRKATRDCRHVKDLLHEAQILLDGRASGAEMGRTPPSMERERLEKAREKIMEERAFPAGRKVVPKKEKAGRYIEVGGDWS